MPHNSNTTTRVPLQHAARELGLTGHGTLKVLKRAGDAVRDDGRWYVFPDALNVIKEARRRLGISRNTTPLNATGGPI